MPQAPISCCQQHSRIYEQTAPRGKENSANVVLTNKISEVIFLGNTNSKQLGSVKKEEILPLHPRLVKGKTFKILQLKRPPRGED